MVAHPKVVSIGKWEMVRWGLFLLSLWRFLCREIVISKPHKTLLALPTKARILCLEFIIEYSSLMDFGP
jgi:hypothetical protein